MFGFPAALAGLEPPPTCELAHRLDPGKGPAQGTLPLHSGGPERSLSSGNRRLWAVSGQVHMGPEAELQQKHDQVI